VVLKRTGQQYQGELKIAVTIEMRILSKGKALMRGKENPYVIACIGF